MINKSLDTDSQICYTAPRFRKKGASGMSRHKHYGNIVLFNNSSYPDEVFVPTLLKCYDLTQCSGRIIVRINKGGKWSCKGLAHRDENPALCQLEARAIGKDGELKLGRMKSDGGWIEFSPYNCPFIEKDTDLIDNAKGMFRIMLHEFYHIYEYQTDHLHQRDWDYKRHDHKYRQRRMNHNKRPQEIRTDNFVKKTMEQYNDDDDVINIILDIAHHMQLHRKKHLKNRKHSGKMIVWPEINTLVSV